MADAITFRAAGQSPGANSATCVIVKPVGLTVGDLMIAQVVGMSAGAQTHATPAGWTKIRQDGTNQPASSLFWKIADGVDVAAADFTFTVTGATSSRGAIVAFYNTNPSAPINANNGQLNASTLTVTSPGITPSEANCMLLLFCAYGNDDTFSGYAIATDNPSWTERYDLPSNLTFDLGLAVATAPRPETSATGNGTATATPFTANNTGQLIAIAPLSAAGQQILGSRYLRGLKNFIK